MRELALSRQHRKSIERINNRVQSEVMRLVHGFDGESFDVLKDALHDLVPIIAQDYGDAAASLALDYYEMAREAAEVGGITLVEAPKVNGEKIDAAIRWSLKYSTGELPSLEMTGRALSGAIARHVLDINSDAILAASVKDKRSVGWRRINDAGACTFCRMLADRGGVYTGSTVRFASHDHCGCSAAPVFDTDRDIRPVSVHAYEASQRKLSDSQRAAMRSTLREYLNANY